MTDPLCVTEDEALIKFQLNCRHGTPPNPPGFAFVKIGPDRHCMLCGGSERQLADYRAAQVAQALSCLYP